MITTFTNATIRMWTHGSDPADDVQNAFGSFAEAANWFWNTSNNTYFICTYAEEEGNQVWTPVFPQLQSDWTQATSGALDYIKNKPSLATVATSGSYTDLINLPPALAFSTPTFSSATSATRLSTTRDAQVVYTFPTSMTSLIASQSLTATLQYADDSGMSTNVVTVNADVQGCSGILSLTLSGRLQVQGMIPAGKYRRVTLGQTGGATVPTTLSSGQEVLL